LPPLPEQEEIVRHLAEWTASFSSLAADVQRAVGLLVEWRTALVDAAVTGPFNLRGLVETQGA
jgi:hypothetical protein